AYPVGVHAALAVEVPDEGQAARLAAEVGLGRRVDARGSDARETPRVLHEGHLVELALDRRVETHRGQQGAAPGTGRDHDLGRLDHAIRDHDAADTAGLHL